MNSISTGFRTSLHQFVFDPTWLDPVAGATVESATGSSQVGSNTPVLRASSEPGRVKYTFFIYARLGLSPSNRVWHPVYPVACAPLLGIPTVYSEYPRYMYGRSKPGLTVVQLCTS